MNKGKTINCRDQFMVMPRSTLAEANEKKD